PRAEAGRQDAIKCADPYPHNAHPAANKSAHHLPQIEARERPLNAGTLGEQTEAILATGGGGAAPATPGPRGRRSPQHNPPCAPAGVNPRAYARNCHHHTGNDKPNKDGIFQQGRSAFIAPKANSSPLDAMQHDLLLFSRMVYEPRRRWKAWGAKAAPVATTPIDGKPPHTFPTPYPPTLLVI